MLFSPVYVELQPRQSLIPGLAPVSICRALPFNFLRIRTSKTPLPQPLYNPHLRRPLGCAGNKGLTGTRIHRQLFCNQHLRTPLRSAENTGLIIPLESALTKNAPATLLESALTKNRGEGVVPLGGFDLVGAALLSSRITPARRGGSHGTRATALQCRK
jgi:hypothetical protein